ncbi:MAG: zf-TFIIB domain-containing protein [Byssovorax sp.]
MSLLPLAATGSCPHCGDSPLTPDPDGSATARCARCQGLWLPQGELAARLSLMADHPFLVEHRRAATATARRCPACRASMLSKIRLGKSFTLQVDHCMTCEGHWIEATQMPAVSAAAASLPRPDGPSRGPLRSPAAAAAEGIFSDRFAFDTPLVNAAAVPAALALALLLDATWLKDLVSSFFINMWLHELGHAAVAWMSGYYALLLPFVTFTFNDEKSLLTSMIVALLLGAALIAGLSGKHRYLVVLGGGGLLLQAIMTLIIPRRLTFEWLTFAGCGGEFVWSTLLMVSFYYRLPDRIRWDFWRYLALLIGAFGLVHAVSMWSDVKHDLSLLPVGTALGGRDDGDGDMNKLINLYHWTPKKIARTYLTMGYVGLLVVGGHYAVFLLRALRRKQEE